MIDLLRNITKSFNSVKNKHWDYSQFVGQEIASLKIGIIGLGRLGKFMAKFAKGFGMQVYIMTLLLAKKYKKTL